MNDILFKINKAIKNYYNKYGRFPSTILINEDDLNFLKIITSPYMDIVDNEKLKEKAIYEICGLKVIPIKYGELQVVEVLYSE